MKKEKPIQNAILRVLNLMHGCMAVTYYNGAIYDPRAKTYRKNKLDRPKGFPDIVGCYNGLAFAIEVKDDNGVLSIEQLRMHMTLETKGWPVCICKSAQEAKDFVESLKMMHVGADKTPPSALKKTKRSI